MLDIPEACGVDVFATMAKIGVMLERNPRIVRKVMLIGVRQDRADYIESEVGI